MIGVASLISVFLALTSAHVYERCELARELTSLGVNKDHLATWVCIAYHESRFDTSARNHGSGDHGLFQISELYWCGPGKACGAPCSAFRDEDISNDFSCVQRIYREHTTLQGDGFLAWVVYPHNCKHNAKKYLVGCDLSLKNGTFSENRARSLKTYESPTSYNINTEGLKFLSINSLIDKYVNKQTNINNDENEYKWIDYKVDNIDELQLPALKGNTVIKVPTTTTTTTTTPKIEPAFEQNYYDDNNNDKTDWIKYKINNIDELELPVRSNNRFFDIVRSLSTNSGKEFKDAPNNNNNKNLINYKIENIDDLKLPVGTNNRFFDIGKSLPRIITEENEIKRVPDINNNNWTNQRIDNIDDLKLPPGTQNRFYAPISPATTAATIVNEYEQGYDDKNNWINFKVDNIDDLKLPVSFRSTFSANEQNSGNSGRQLSWLDIKVDDNNSIKLPVFGQNVIKTVKTTTPRTVRKTTTTTTTTTIDPSLIGIKPPMPRRIETNQFRKRIMSIIAMTINNITEIRNDNERKDILKPALSPTSISSELNTIPVSQTTTIRPVTSAPSYTQAYNYQQTTSKREETFNNVFNFQKKYTLRPNIVTQETVTSSRQENTTPITSQENQIKYRSRETYNIDKTILSTSQLPASNDKGNEIVIKEFIQTSSTPEIKKLPVTYITTTPPNSNKFINKDLLLPTALTTQVTQKPLFTTTSKPDAFTKSVTTTYNSPFYSSKLFREPFSTIKPPTAKFKSSGFKFGVVYTPNTSITNSPSIVNKSFEEIPTTPAPLLSSTSSSLLNRPSWSNNASWKSPFSNIPTAVSNKTIQERFNSSVSLTSATTVSPTSLRPFTWRFNSLPFKSNVFNPFNTSSTEKVTTSRPYSAFNSFPSKAETIQKPRVSFSFSSITNKPDKIELNVPSSSTTLGTTTTKQYWSYTPTTSKPTLPSSSRTYFTNKPTTTKLDTSSISNLVNSRESIINITSTTRPNPFYWTRPQASTVTTTASSSPTKSTDRPTTKTTPSIFDLYLKPDRQPTWQPFNFPSYNFTSKKLTIFNGGTTKPPLS